jgi:hypothetical protein
MVKSTLTRTVIIGVIILGISIIASGCSGTSPAAPSSTDRGDPVKRTSSESSRWIWGNWKMYIPADRSRIDILPWRNVDMHYNVKVLLEQNPCNNCIWTSNLKNNGDGTVSIDVTIRHPYQANKYFTGFDVRGIFYSPAHYFIEIPSEPHDPYAAYFPALEKGDPQLLNPDGYTNAFSPFTETGKPPIFSYQPDGHLGGTLDIDDNEEEFGKPYWPYICFYSSEVRRLFDVNSKVTRTYHIALPPGAWEFGYSVDACWAPPIHVPVYDIEEDFPWQANQLDIYKIDTSLSGPIIGDGETVLTSRLYTHFPELLGYYSSVIILCQTLHAGWVMDGLATIIDDEYIEFNTPLSNFLGRPPGVYPVIVYAVMSKAGHDYLSNEKGITENWTDNATVASVVWITVES